jgi:hypothetical protein
MTGHHYEVMAGHRNADRSDPPAAQVRDLMTCREGPGRLGL